MWLISKTGRKPITQFKNIRIEPKYNRIVYDQRQNNFCRFKGDFHELVLFISAFSYLGYVLC
jgi:hypothetical protein